MLQIKKKLLITLINNLLQIKDYLRDNPIIRII